MYEKYNDIEINEFLINFNRLTSTAKVKLKTEIEKRQISFLNEEKKKQLDQEVSLYENQIKQLFFLKNFGFGINDFGNNSFEIFRLEKAKNSDLLISVIGLAFSLVVILLLFNQIWDNYNGYSEFDLLHIAIVVILLFVLSYSTLITYNAIGRLFKYSNYRFISSGTDLTLKKNKLEYKGKTDDLDLIQNNGETLLIMNDILVLDAKPKDGPLIKQTIIQIYNRIKSPR